MTNARHTTTPRTSRPPDPAELDADRCYAALASRDSRFDGRFVVGVRTTGVYCRPICPARTPAPENVRFLPSAAAAEAAGFRPCRRCRPETSPGSPAWRGTDATVRRASALIADGFLDSGRVTDLADRLGIGERHLRRLFEQHVGASPGALARSQRAHLARCLLDDASRSVADVAALAGYPSPARLTADMKRVFGTTPSHMRRAGPLREPGEGLSVRLPVRTPFDWNAMLAYWRPRAIAGVEHVDGDTYRRVVGVDGRRIPISVTVVPAGEPRGAAGRSSLELRVPSDVGASLARVIERVRVAFDTRANPVAIEDHLGGCAFLGPLVARARGMRVPGAFDGFELAVRAVLGQQVSVAGATTLAGRLVSELGARLGEPDAAGAITHAFPSPEVVAGADLARLGMPGRRAEAIRALARGVCEGRLRLEWGADPEALTAALIDIPGIGPWTAGYVTMRVAGDPDAFLPGDLGVRKAVRRRSVELDAGGPPAPDGLPRPSEILSLASRWRPWRAYAVMILWHSLGD